MLPLNRHILINLVKEEQKETSVLVPEDFKQKSPYIKAEVLAIAPDCSIDVKVGDKILLNNSMTEEVTCNNKTYTFVLQNYVLAVFKN